MVIIHSQFVVIMQYTQFNLKKVCTLLKLSKESTLIISSGNLRKCEYLYVIVYTARPLLPFLPTI